MCFSLCNFDTNWKEHQLVQLEQTAKNKQMWNKEVKPSVTNATYSFCKDFLFCGRHVPGLCMSKHPVEEHNLK